ncbi:MAG: ATP/GTP-binding protein [Candidatus Hodarchaeaceae archaeon]|nr:ATP/GTP-binding protein [Candidatus Hodarchaeaceae archaeon]
MRPLNLIVLGTAGAGKSALTATLGRWIEQNTDQKVAYINLDPGCDFVPFKPDFDIRDYFTIAKIMRDENLGPNGAMIRASELLEQKAGEFSGQINKIKVDIRLIDTPGQMEVFLFHGGPEITRLMGGVTISLFLTDVGIAAKAAGLIFTRLLGLSVGLRLGVPTVSVLNKMDLAEGKLADVDRMLADVELLKEQVIRESSGVMIDLTLSLSKALPELLPAARLVKVSAKSGEGMAELYDMVHEIFCACGDLT